MSDMCSEIGNAVWVRVGLGISLSLYLWYAFQNAVIFNCNIKKLQSQQQSQSRQAWAVGNKK